MAKKVTKKKTRYIGVMDQSSFHLEGGAELEITEKTLTRLKRLNGSPWIRGNIDRNQQFHITNNVEGLPVSYGEYYVADTGGRLSLKARGNPSKIMTGTNAKPCRASLKEAEKYGHNDHTRTFGFGLRLPFLLLEHVPMINGEERGFRWTDEERRIIDDGSFKISQLQLAFYSASFESVEKRDLAMIIIQGLYAGDGEWPVNFEPDKKGRKHVRLAEYLNIDVRAFHMNTTLSVLHGKNKTMTITLYAKDRHLEDMEAQVSETSGGLSTRIRFDVTLTPRYLGGISGNKKGYSLSCRELESFYVTKCEEAGRYDSGFYDWFVEDIDARLNLTYLLNNLGTAYREKTQQVRNFLDDPNGFNDQRRAGGLSTLKERHRILLEKWYTTQAVYRTATDLCWKSFGPGDAVLESKVNPGRLLKEIEQTFGLDLTVPRQYLRKANMNGVVNVLTDSELDDMNAEDFRTNMSLPEWLNDKFERIDFAKAGISTVLRKSEEADALGKFRLSGTSAPLTIKRFEDMYAIRCFESS